MRLFLFSFSFVYFWQHWVSIAALGLSLVVASGGYSPVVVCCLLATVVSCCKAHILGLVSFSSCGPQTFSRIMWYLPRAGIEPMLPALAGNS